MQVDINEDKQQASVRWRTEGGEFLLQAFAPQGFTFIYIYLKRRC